MNPAGTRWLDGLLSEHLRPAAAPEGLWDRIVAPRDAPKRRSASVWALGGAVAAVAVLLILAVPAIRRAPQHLYSTDPVEMRAWIRNCTGIDVPLAAALPPAMELVEARAEGEAASIVFRVEGREAVLTAAKGRKGAGAVGHEPGASAWQARGVAYAVTGVAKMEAACRLCHEAI